MRHEYPLSTYTIKTINGKATEVAEEAGVSKTTIYNILEQKDTDPFSKFEILLFAPAVRAGCDVSPWLNRLEAIVSKYRPLTTASPFDCLARKIEANAASTKATVKSLEDGEVTDIEIGKIQTAIRAERKVLDELELGLLKAAEPRAKTLSTGGGK